MRRPKPSAAGDLTSICRYVERKLNRILGEKPALIIVFQTNKKQAKDGSDCHWVSNHRSRKDTIEQLRDTADAMEASLNE